MCKLLNFTVYTEIVFKKQGEIIVLLNIDEGWMKFYHVKDARWMKDGCEFGVVVQIGSQPAKQAAELKKVCNESI